MITKSSFLNSRLAGLLAALIAFGFIQAPLMAQSNDDFQTGGTNNTGAQAEPAEAGSNSTAQASESSASGLEARGVNRDALVSIGHDVELKAGESAEVVVVVGGSATIHGKVRSAVTVIGGNAYVDGEVGEQVVAVMGNIKMGKGGLIKGDAVAVGGKIDVTEGGSIKGQAQEVELAGVKLPKIQWLKNWVIHCALMLRPLAPQVGWVWVVAAIFLLFYLFLAAVFPGAVQSCVNELNRRPATTFLMGLLTKLLLPLVLLILIVTVIGTIVVPFVLAALFLGAIVGKVGLLEWLGFRIGRLFGGGGLQKPLAALLAGWVVVTLLYMVPVLGLLVLGVTSIWGLGAAVTAAFGGMRREMPERPAPPQMPVEEFVPAAATFASPTGASAAAMAAPEGQSSSATIPAQPPVMPEVLAYPRAGFWERMGAGFLDVVLVCILGAVVQPFAPLVALAYFSGMWAWKGTTIGGIVLGLKVVRTDGQPVTFLVALVRGLAAAFSIFVLFLGFLWIAWDHEKQGWHDKIAGTVVLRTPRGTPLVCL